MIKNWEELFVLKWYYDCNSVNNWDIVIYNFSANKNPLVKRIMWWPWDKFEYKWLNIFINNKILKNSIWNDFKINSKMIELYSNSYPIIPDNTYLILWDNISWTMDSSRFWLVSGKNIIWKVILD